MWRSGKNGCSAVQRRCPSPRLLSARRYLKAACRQSPGTEGLAFLLPLHFFPPLFFASLLCFKAGIAFSVFHLAFPRLHSGVPFSSPHLPTLHSPFRLSSLVFRRVVSLWDRSATSLGEWRCRRPATPIPYPKLKPPRCFVGRGCVAATGRLSPCLCLRSRGVGDRGGRENRTADILSGIVITARTVGWARRQNFRTVQQSRVHPSTERTERKDGENARKEVSSGRGAGSFATVVTLPGLRQVEAGEQPASAPSRRAGVTASLVHAVVSFAIALKEMYGCLLLKIVGYSLTLQLTVSWAEKKRHI